MKDESQHSITVFLLASAVVVMSLLFQSDRTNQIKVAQTHVVFAIYSYI